MNMLNVCIMNVENIHTQTFIREIHVLLDIEQQELLQAAKIIQNAYRQFKVIVLSECWNFKF